MRFEITMKDDEGSSMIIYDFKEIDKDVLEVAWDRIKNAVDRKLERYSPKEFTKIK